MPIPSLRRACCGGFTLLTLVIAAAQARAACDPLNYVLPAPNAAMPRIGSGQTVTNTNPNGCQDGFAIAIDTGGTLVNRGGFTVLPGLRGANGNGGLLVLGGTLNNATGATLDNRADLYVGVAPFYGGTLNNGGVITNNAQLVSAGEFNNGPFGRITNKATMQLVGTNQAFTNAGLLQNQGSLTMNDIGGSFANHGQIDNAASAVIELSSTFGVLNWAGGTVNNSGVLRVTTLTLGVPTVYGTFNLLAGGTLEHTVLTLAQGLSQDNAGLIRNDRGMAVYGTLVNTGEIQSTAALTIDYPGFGLALMHNVNLLTLGSASGTWTGALPSPVTSTNSGLLKNDGTLVVKADALVINGGVDIFGNPNGQLQNYAQLQVYGRIENRHVLLNNSEMTVYGEVENRGQLINYGALVNQGRVTSAGTLYNEALIDNQAQFTVTGNFTLNGTMTNSGRVSFSAGSVTQGQGSYQQSAGVTWLDGSVTMREFQINDGSLCGTGKLNGSLFASDMSVCAAAGAPMKAGAQARRLALTADAPQGLTVSGDLVLSGGRLSFDIGGTAPGSFGSLVIGGHVLGTRGTLQLNFINGYQPAIGSSWALLGSQDVDPLGGFTLEVAGLPAGYGFAAGAGGSIGVTTVPVPEPQTAWLLLTGLGFVSWRRAGRHWAAACEALRRWRPNHLPAAVALAAVCAAHAPAGATVLVSAGAQVTAGNQGTSPLALSQQQAGPVGVTVAQGNDTTESWVRQASATATASVGSLRVATQSTYLHTQGQPRPNDRYANASASADASWTDTLLITSPTHTTGSGGHWIGMLALSADLTSVMYADKLPQPVGATVSLFATGLSGAPPNPLSNVCDLAGLTCLNVFHNQQATGTWLLPVEVSFSYGQAFSFYVSLRANSDAQAYGCDDCTLASTVANGTSLTWQGTSAILDASRHPVTDATLSSEARFNYLLAAPVPEPSGALLMVLGALVIAWRRRVGQVR